MELPPELRQQVYAFYFDALPLTYPDVVPPLLLSSRQLSHEASNI